MSFWDMIPPGMAEGIRADDAVQENKRKLEELERQDRAWTAARMNEAAENAFRYQTGHTSAEYRDAMSRIALAKENRNPAAEYGSATRAAILVDGQELTPVERTQPGPWTRDPVDVQLARAREVGNDPFMRRMVAEFDARRGGKRSISRSETPETITCVECVAENVTVDEWLELHHGADPLPEVTVPDHAPSRSRRVRAGTGWPEIAR